MNSVETALLVCAACGILFGAWKGINKMNHYYSEIGSPSGINEQLAEVRRQLANSEQELRSAVSLISSLPDNTTVSVQEMCDSWLKVHGYETSQDRENARKEKIRKINIQIERLVREREDLE